MNIRALNGEIAKARYSVGELVHHSLFDYRGVVIDVDASFLLSDEWYDQVARSRPPKDQPWYHVLVHEAKHMTYVAERNLQPDIAGLPIQHPWLQRYFTGMDQGRYVRLEREN